MVRRSKTQWQELIEQQKSSGLSAAEFCRRNSISAKYFSLRKRQLDNDSKPFVKLVPPAGQTGFVSKVVKLRIIELDLPQESMSEWLSVLVDRR